MKTAPRVLFLAAPMQTAANGKADEDRPSSETALLVIARTVAHFAQAVQRDTAFSLHYSDTGK